MGVPVLIMGESGSGKSTSMRNFDAKEVGIFNVYSKMMPFRKKLNTINHAEYEIIKGVLSKKTLKTYVIDDSQGLMSDEFFNRAKEQGFNKFTDIGLNFRNLVNYVINELPNDTIVYFLHHTEVTAEGKTKAKTIGKMLDEKLTLEGLFSIVLLCKKEKGRNFFETQSDGATTAKSPIEMFDFEIDNDLKFVDETIRKYYEFESEDK